MTALLLAVGAASGTVSHAQGQRDAAPCTKAVSACTEWVNVAAGPQHLLVYRSYPLDVRNQSITRALINIHGGARDVTGVFNTALAAAFLAGALEDIVTEHFVREPPNSVLAHARAHKDADARRFAAVYNPTVQWGEQ